MKIKRLMLSIVGTISAFAAAIAAPAFIQHRQDCFKAVPPSEDQIIFLGNSITNFHCWADAFVRPEGLAQDVALISNRGISDERAYHWKYNVQMMLDGEKKPAKIFIGIGTNDLNVGLPPEVVVNDIRTIIRQIQISSPATEINLQSILPRGGDINNVVSRTVPMLEEMAAEMDVNFIDLTQTMTALGAFGNWTVDNLHPNGVGYRAWCRHIAPNVGLECAYVDGANNYAGFSSIAGIHTSQYGLMPVNEDDILIIGDQWVDAVQWHEFLGNANIKNRSIGGGNLAVANFKTLIDRTLKANDRQKCPKAIVLCWGANRTTGTVRSDYESLITYAKQAAPNAQIIVCQTPPLNADGHAANVEIKKITAAPVVDLEAKGMTAETTDQWNMAGGIGGRGALYAAQAVGETLNAVLGAGTAKIPSTADFEERYANRNRRIEVAKCFNALYQHQLEANKDLSEAIAQIEEILKGNTVTAAQVTQAQSIRDKALNGLTFTPDTEKWYHISSPRNYEGANASVASISHSGSNPFLVDKKLSATATDGSDIWAFRQRPDGTYDILSYDGFYLIPGNVITASKVYPTEGWTIEGGSAETGTYIISCGEVYLHRDGSNNLVNYWKKGDTGCDFYITEYPGELPDLDEKISDGWVSIKISGGLNVESYGIAGKNVLNHPTGIRRSNGFYELTMQDIDADHPANAFFRLRTNDDGTWTITGLTGHAYMENGVATRTNTEKTLGVNIMDITTYNIGYWVPFKEGGVPMVGRSQNNRAIFTVQPADVADYDVWTVNIIATENDLNESTGDIANIINDTHVTFASTANKGLATVYNGGAFFLEPGTEFTADDLVVECPNLANQSQDYCDIVIDPNTKTIYIDYSAGLPNGWYSFELHSMEGTNANAKSWTQEAQNAGHTSLINTDGIYKQNSTNFYPMGFGPEPEDKVARQYFYLDSTGDHVYTIRTLHGYYLKDAATASYDPVDLSIPPHATLADVYKTTFMVWKGHGLPGANDYTYLTGKFSGNFSYYTIKSADIEHYDIYNVCMIEGYRGGEMPADASVTFKDDDNHGITTVHNNGSFFVTKGYDLKPEMLTASHLEGQPAPKITVEPGVITVDYSPVIVESIEIDKTELNLHTGETAQLTAEVKPEEAHNKQIFWSSSDEEVATVSEEGLVSAIKAGETVIRAYQGEISAECKLTVIATEITLSESHLEMEVEDEVTLTATVSNATEGATTTWSSSDQAIATVDAEGKVTAVAAGHATITATCDDATAECEVIVSAKDIDSIREIKAAAARGELFDLKGRKVMKPEKGVYILSDGTTVIL